MLALMAGQGFRFVRPLNFHTVGKSGAIIEMDALFEKIEPGSPASQGSAH